MNFLQGPFHERKSLYSALKVSIFQRNKLCIGHQNKEV